MALRFAMYSETFGPLLPLYVILIDVCGGLRGRRDREVGCVCSRSIWEDLWSRVRWRWRSFGWEVVDR